MENAFYKSPEFMKYRTSLAGFCSCCVELSFYKEKIINGEMIEDEDTRLLCEKLSFFKKELLNAKEELGFDDGLLFMENNHFQGFEIKDGCLIGNPDLAFTILKPWYEGFPAEKEINNYEYEVANFLLSFLLEQEKQKVRVNNTGDRKVDNRKISRFIKKNLLKLKNKIYQLIYG